MKGLNSKAGRALTAVASLAIAIIVYGAPLFGASKDAPSWVIEAASRTVPAYTADVPAAVMFDEHHAIVSPSGAVTTLTRHVVKILTSAGRSEAEGIEFYTKNGRQVRQLRAWIVVPGRRIKTVDSAMIEDLGSFGQLELYDDVRFRRIAFENVEVGSIFAYESEVVQTPLFAQDEYDFQNDLPVLNARYVLTLPPAWRATGVVFNHQPLQPVIEGSTYTWELDNLPPRRKEPEAPSLRGCIPRLGISFKPPAGTPGAVFASWTDVSRWETTLTAGQDNPTPEMAAKVRELTRGVDTQYDKARLIGHFVQGIRYVAIEMDSTHGGTYRPHKAEMVFGKRYGDCKDKANLMRAMLKNAGIDSYLVLAHSGDRTFVSADWPSPYQFNHMIVAVRVCDGPQSATLSDSLLGPLLFFDPTDDATAFGDFPSYEQGSLVLVCAAERGQLLVVPMRTPDSNTIDRVVDARLKANGGVEAVVSTVATGQPARDERARLAAGGPERYKSETQRSLFPSTRSATVSKLETADVFEQNIFKARLEFSSAVYGEAMQHSMVVFDPSMLALDVPAFAGGYRAEPILLQPLARHTKVRIELPPGYSVDEIPQGLELETEFARFRVAYNHAAGELDVDEELRTEGVTLPASESIRVKRFFDEVRRADNQEAVLVRLH